MTSEELKHIQEIRGLAGFRVIQSVCEKRIAELKDVTSINKNELVAEQTLARQLAVKTLKDILNDLTIIIKPEGEKNNTYE